jgi:hypothetical protein
MRRPSNTKSSDTPPFDLVLGDPGLVEEPPSCLRSTASMLCCRLRSRQILTIA